MARAMLAGRKTQLRVLADSPLAAVSPGERLWVREATVPARHAGGRDYATALAKADFAIFPDGWRQPRAGEGWQGKPPADGDHVWLTALRMPRWACRAELTVEWRRAEPLRRIGRKDIRAEGAKPLLPGLFWRWPSPIPGIRLTARTAFAYRWNLDHPTPGDRWQDDPHVIVLGFRSAAPDRVALVQDSALTLD